MAVIFAYKFIYETYYVCGKQSTYNSAKNSNNKFYNFCHLTSSFVSISYMMSRGYLYKLNITIQMWLYNRY